MLLSIYQELIVSIIIVPQWKGPNLIMSDFLAKIDLMDTLEELCSEETTSDWEAVSQ